MNVQAELQKRDHIPCQEAFDASFRKGGHVVSVALKADLVKQINTCPSISLSAFDEPSQLCRSSDGSAATCIIVGADGFDIEAMPRLRGVRNALGSETNACVVAVTSFMSGAFGKYACQQGADLCITEEYLANAIALAAEIAGAFEVDHKRSELWV